MHKLPLIFLFLITCLNLGQASAQDESLSHIQDALIISEIAHGQLKTVEATMEKKVKYSELSKTKQKLLEISYAFVHTKAFMLQKAKMVSFAYPEIYIVDSIARLTTLFVVDAYLISIGHPEYIIAYSLMFPILITDTTYYFIRKLIDKYHTKLKYGFTPDELEKIKHQLYGEENLKNVRWHILNYEKAFFRIPVGSKIKTADLEDLIKDIQFLKECHKLKLSPAVYESVLLQKIMQTPELKNQLFEQIAGKQLSVAKGLAEFMASSDLIIDQIKSFAAANENKKVFEIKNILEADMWLAWLQHRSERSDLYALAKKIQLEQWFWLSEAGKNLNFNQERANERLKAFRQDADFFRTENIYLRCNSIYQK